MHNKNKIKLWFHISYKHFTQLLPEDLIFNFALNLGQYFTAMFQNIFFFLNNFYVKLLKYVVSTSSIRYCKRDLVVIFLNMGKKKVFLKINFLPIKMQWTELLNHKPYWFYLLSKGFSHFSGTLYIYIYIYIIYI